MWTLMGEELREFKRLLELEGCRFKLQWVQELGPILDTILSVSFASIIIENVSS